LLTKGGVIEAFNKESEPKNKIKILTDFILFENPILLHLSITK